MSYKKNVFRAPRWVTELASSLMKTVQDFHRITSGRHPGSPGANATGTMPHPTKPANIPHVREDTQTTVNLDTSEEHTGLKKTETTAEAESAQIKENQKTPEAQRPHKFQAAKWTHPNGHPRCILCGDEERTGGMCSGAVAPLEKAMPRFVGEVDPQKENVAVPHPLNPRDVVWQHQPAKAKSFQNRIDQNIDKFTSQFGEHGPALKAGLQRVLANKKHTDLVPTALKAGDTHAPRRRHVAYLVTGDPAAKIKHIGNGEFIWRQDRHGETPGQHTWWKVNHQGVQDVTKQYENKPQDFFEKSDKVSYNKGDANDQATRNGTGSAIRNPVLGGNGITGGPLAKADELAPVGSGVNDLRSAGHSGQSRGASGSQAAAGDGVKVLMFFYAQRKSAYEPPKSATGVKVAWIPGSLFVDKADGYYKPNGRSRVKGEAMMVDASELPQMDKEESAANYARVPVQTEDGRQAFAYAWRGKLPDDVIASPSWPAHSASPIWSAKDDKPLTKSEPVHVSTVAVIDPVTGAILMGRRQDDGRYTNPGGHGNPGEDPLRAAKRELFEESGIRAKHLTYLGSKSVTTHEGKQKIIHCYAMFGKPTGVTGKNDPDAEVRSWYWVNIKDGKLPAEVVENLHSPRNALLELLGLMS